MQAIILAGGLGTRLRQVVADVPKPMAPIQGEPFLAHLLQYLKRQGITRVIFPIHYMGETIRAYFQSQYAGMEIFYAQEESPLGTGGAMVNALPLLRDAHEPVFILNGDTFLKLDYQAMYEQHEAEKSVLTMALRSVEDCARYGKVMTNGRYIAAFREKGEAGPGLINAGVYLIHPGLFTPFELPSSFSFEHDFLLPHLNQLKPRAFVANDYFIDIGIPEDYARAVSELPALET
ncbi:D-glycero-alpha-D-manno-heptose 1-phosphate guanylyltransferase [Aquicella siphonis]|uniref:D-glycero-alpha-D-manno-heptose 1-phosphate guanylyltransferase n=1 Tax=Aquicella siphonis TaxID=254247 RepID=A0A5E4PHL2_9COXI|nr:nucleotidyltransferase family protein [Aquicella siphonis]VVC76499.1 D-glycero-alpha-D-manno-heptose 1-phosphate guanylyltransferase [Aquicella siphonis]